MSIAAGGGRMKQIIIIGAGPAGLTAAYELLDRGGADYAAGMRTLLKYMLNPKALETLEEAED